MTTQWLVVESPLHIMYVTCQISYTRPFMLFLLCYDFLFSGGVFAILLLSFCGGKLNLGTGFNGHGFPSLFGEMLTKLDIWSGCCSGEIWFVTNRLLPHLTFTKLFLDCIAVDVLTFLNNIYAYSTAIKTALLLHIDIFTTWIACRKYIITHNPILALGPYECRWCISMFCIYIYICTV